MAVFSLLSGRIVHISEQAASILNCKKKVLDSSRFVELLVPQDVSVFYTHTDQSHLPLWNVESQTGGTWQCFSIRYVSFCHCRLSVELFLLNALIAIYISQANSLYSLKTQVAMQRVLVVSQRLNSYLSKRQTLHCFLYHLAPSKCCGFLKRNCQSNCECKVV